jgi:hypothetical protein
MPLKGIISAIFIPRRILRKVANILACAEEQIQINSQPELDLKKRAGFLLSSGAASPSGGAKSL